MKIRTRLVLLFAGLIALLVVGLSSVRLFEMRRGQILLRNAQQEKEQTFDRIIQLQGASLAALAFDYTFWDDMVQFVEATDLAWGQENLDTALSTYKVDGIWVLRPNFSLVYAASTIDDAAFRVVPLRRDTLEKLFAGPPAFKHLFVSTPHGLLELRTAPIQPSSDTARETAPRGYFMTGRLWTPDYLQELMRLTDSRLALTAGGGPVEAGYDGRQGGWITFARPLPGADGQPVARLDVRSSYPILHELDRLSRTQLSLLIALSLVALGFLWVLLTRWITRPLGLLTRSLDTQSPDLLAPLAARRTEMGRLAALITQFFEQRRILEDSNQALEDFAQVAAHDLKAPLNVLGGYVELLADAASKRLGPQEQEAVGFIRGSVKQMHNLISDLLQVSRLSHLPNTVEPVDISLLLSEIKGRFSPVIKQKGIQLHIEEPLPTLPCDRVRIGEVFANLISNAIKYNDKAACRINIRSRQSDGYYEFTVADNGIGIPPQYLPHTFQMFQRFHKELDYEGSGVGLAIVKKIVELHHGKIWLDSTPGEGTTFFFTLPAAHA